MSQSYRINILLLSTLLRLQRDHHRHEITQGAAALYPGLCAFALTARQLPTWTSELGCPIFAHQTVHHTNFVISLIFSYFGFGYCCVSVFVLQILLFLKRTIKHLEKLASGIIKYSPSVRWRWQCVLVASIIYMILPITWMVQHVAFVASSK